MATLRLKVEGVKVGVLAFSCTIEERIGAPFEARLHCELSTPDGHPFDAGTLLAHDASIELEADDVARKFAGQIDAVEEDDTGTVVVVVGKAQRLLRTSDHRVFVDATALDAARTLLDEHELSLDVKARGKPPKRVQLVQRFESDLAFVTRILAEEGMSWVAPPDEPGVIRVLDEPGTFPDTEIVLDVVDEGGLEHGRALHGASIEERVAPTQVKLREYDFTRPQLELDVGDGDGPLEQFEFPAGFASKDEGEALAQTRLAQHRALHAVLRAEATEPGLRAGSVFTIDAAPIDAMSDRWLVVSIRHLLRLRAGRAERSYDASLRAVPAKAGFRAPREPAAQRAPGGVCTATATGGGGEIAVDEHGRTRALLRWDRRGKGDETASTHARVLQPQLSGSIFNPRVGWEELCAFAPGADVPIALGRLYNGAQRPPSALPAGKVETHFGTLSTPAGSGGNGLSISDAAGKEKLGIVASRDFVEQIEKDKVVKIGVDHERAVDGKRELEVHERIVVVVDGAHATTVGALRKVETQSNYVLTAASENVFVGGARLFTTGGDYSTTTSNLVRVVVGKKGEAPIEHQSIYTLGASTLIVGGSLTTKFGHMGVAVGGMAVVQVMGAQTVKCHGKYSISAKGGLGESYGPRTVKAKGKYVENYRKGTWHVKGDCKVTGTEVAIEAKDKLTIKADGLTIEMTPSSIEVQGPFEGMTPSVEEGNHKYG